jgi:tetratricopeptide (TPR) repeat protein
MKALLFLIALLSLMARSTAACPIASTQSVSPTAAPPPSCLPSQPAISANCQLAGIEAIKNRDYREAALADLAFQYAVAGELNQALDLSDRLDQKSKILSVVVQMIEPLASQRSPDQLVAILTRVSQNADALKTPAVKVNLLTQIAQAWIRSERQDQAIAILPKLLTTVQSIKDAEEREKQVATIAVMYAKVGNFDQAIKLAETLTVEQKDDTLGEIASSLAAVGQFESALQMVDRIQSNFYKASTLEQISLAYTKAGKKPEALTVLSQAVQFVEKMDVEQESQERNDFLGSFAVQFVEIGQDEKAFQVIGKIEPFARASKAADLADYYLERKQYDRVMQVIQVMKAAGDQDRVSSTLSSLATHYITLGQYDRALEIANTLEDRSPWEGQSVGVTPDPEGRSGKLGVLTYLASEYAKKGEKAKAIALFDSVLNLAKSSATSTEWAEIALTYDQAIGDRVKAIMILDRALNQARQKPDPSFQDFILSRLAEIYATIGDVEKALQVVNLVPIDPQNPEQSQQSKAETLVNIASTLYEKGAFKEALPILRSIKQQEIDPFRVYSRFGLSEFEDPKTALLTQMIYQAVNDKQYDRAIQAAQAMDEPSERDRFIKTIDCSRSKR